MASNCRSSPGRRRRWIAALAIAASLAPAGHAAQDKNDARKRERREALAAARRGEHDTPTPYWREGPVRYLLSQDEDREFQKLRTRDERARFIQRFWASRDPDPSTPGNQFRELFYRRVAEATRLFAASTKPGWKTDRGKIYVILGPPDEQDQFVYRQLVPTVILWTYRDPPPGSGVSANSTIRFLRDRSGEYRLDSRLRLSGIETTLSIGLQMQAMQVKSLPEPRELLDALVSTPARSTTEPFRTHFDYFGGGPGRTIAVITLGVRESLLSDERPPADAAGIDVAPLAGMRGAGDEGRFQAVARLIGEPPLHTVHDLAGVNGLRLGKGNTARDPQGYLLFQGAATVEPGDYTTYLGVLDLHTGRTHSIRESMEVPEFPEDSISVSRIALAARLDRLDTRPAYGYAAPFVFGDLRAVPRAGNTFHRGEPLQFYYQVYGATLDAVAGRPSFDLEYQILAAREVGAGGDLVFAPYGNSIQLTHLHNSVQGYSLRLDGWAPGTYMLLIRATDLLGEGSASNMVTFQVL